MPIIFEQLAPSQDADEITVRGSVSIDGYALGQAVAGNAIIVIGAVAVVSNATMDSEFGEATPVVPALIDGVMFVSGYSTLGGVVSSRLDVDGVVDMAGQAYSDSAVEGVVFISGDAEAGGSYQGGYTFAVEPQAVIACYVGQAFGQARDVVGFASMPSRLYTATLRSRMALGLRAASQFDGVGMTNEALGFADTPSLVLQMLIAEGITFSTLASGGYRLLARAVSRLILTGEASSYAEALQLIADALAFSELLDWMQTSGVTDAVVLGGRLDSFYAAFAAVVEQLVLSAQAIPEFTLTVMLRDGFVVGSQTTHAAELTAQLAEAIGFAMSLSFDNGEFIAWVLNTESRGLTRYTNYPFNSFAKVGRHYYGAHAGGIARIGGDRDMGEAINAKLRLGMFDFGDRHLKSFSDVFIGMAASGQMLLKAIFVDEQSGEKNMAIYKVLPRPAGASRETRARIGRGMKAVDWDFELENVDGAGFDLQSIQFYPTQLSRRTRG